MSTGIIQASVVGGVSNSSVLREIGYQTNNFNTLASRLTARTFCRIFRMSRHTFDQLCHRFIDHVGVYTFRPQVLSDNVSLLTVMVLIGVIKVCFML